MENQQKTKLKKNTNKIKIKQNKRARIFKQVLLLLRKRKPNRTNTKTIEKPGKTSKTKHKQNEAKQNKTKQNKTKIKVQGL